MTKTESIRFYYNGIRINGEKRLVKLFYSLDNDHRFAGECVSLSAYDGGSLPSDLFPVENDTDYYTDYFDNDRATIGPDHRLYKYARYAGEACKIKHLEHIIKRESERIAAGKFGYAGRERLEKELAQHQEQLAALRQHTNPGNPSADDLEACRALELEEENARRAAELEEEQKERERVLCLNSECRHIVADAMEHFPVKSESPVVVIEWSENPALPEGLRLSPAAAEIIFYRLDARIHADNARGYDKTSFVVEYDGGRYTGRYDLGDNDGGLIAHIRAFGEWRRTHDQYGHMLDGEKIIDFTAYRESAQILAVAELLENSIYTA